MENVRQNFYEELAHLRNDFSNDMPDEMIHGTLRFKVQRNWFNRVQNTLRKGVGSGFFSDRTLPHIRMWIDRVTSAEFKSRDRTSESDIELADQLIDFTLEEMGRESESHDQVAS